MTDTERTAARAAIATLDVVERELAAAIAPVRDWFESDEDAPRPLLEIVRDIVKELSRPRCLTSCGRLSRWCCSASARDQVYVRLRGDHGPGNVANSALTLDELEARWKRCCGGIESET